jgi:hypothetical protein
MKDLKDVDVHLINAGHFALEGNVDLYTFLIKRFLKTRLSEATVGDEWPGQRLSVPVHGPAA